MTVIQLCVIGEEKMGCHYINDYNSRCDYKYELRYLLFRDPISKQSNEISICPRHFGETVEEPLILPLKKLYRKRDNLFAQDKRERAIAKRNDMALIPTKRIQIDAIREEIRKKQSLICSNVICGTSISKLNPVFSMMIISTLGKISYKFYFCTRDCWDKMRIRTGALKPVIRKEIPIQKFF